MTDFVTLTCPSCGGKLQITNDIEQFVCGHCGNEHVVRRGGGIIAIAPVIESIKKVQTGTDKTASELAIKRLGNEIYYLRLELVELLRSIKNDSPGSSFWDWERDWGLGGSSKRSWVKCWVIVDYFWEKGKINKNERNKLKNNPFCATYKQFDNPLLSLSSADLEELEHRVRELLDKSKGQKRIAYEELIEWCQQVEVHMKTIQDKSSELKLHEQRVKM